MAYESYDKLEFYTFDFIKKSDKEITVYNEYAVMDGKKFYCELQLYEVWHDGKGYTYQDCGDYKVIEILPDENDRELTDAEIHAFCLALLNDKVTFISEVDEKHTKICRQDPQRWYKTFEMNGNVRN